FRVHSKDFFKSACRWSCAFFKSLSSLHAETAKARDRPLTRMKRRMVHRRGRGEGPLDVGRRSTACRTRCVEACGGPTSECREVSILGQSRHEDFIVGKGCSAAVGKNEKSAPEKG